jgi:DNA-binding transcriptional LysR family regulator
MDWDKLRIFHAVAQAGSFTGAGETLHLNQSSVSRHIAQLEESLGIALFHRHARGLVLTEQGELLHAATSEITSKLNMLEGRLSDTRKKPEGPLVVTVSNFIGSTWLAPHLGAFIKRYPEIQLTILYDDRVLNLNMREADAAIRLHKPTQAGLIPRHLKTIQFHICASRDYLEKNGRPQNITDLSKHQLIAFPYNTHSPIQNPNWLFEVANLSIHKHNNLTMLNSLYAIYKAVEDGAGIAALPDYIACNNPALEIVLETPQREPADLYFVYAQERRNSIRISAFRDFLLEIVEKEHRK